MHTYCRFMRSTCSVALIDGLDQNDTFNCGVCLCLHAYVWLLHPHPQTFDWQALQQKLPNLLTIFREYIAATLITGNVTDIFNSTTLTTLMQPAQPARRPQTTPTIIELLQKNPPTKRQPAQPAESQTPSTTRRKSRKQRQRHAKKRHHHAD